MQEKSRADRFKVDFRAPFQQLQSELSVDVMLELNNDGTGDHQVNVLSKSRPTSGILHSFINHKENVLLKIPQLIIFIQIKRKHNVKHVPLPECFYFIIVDKCSSTSSII